MSTYSFNVNNCNNLMNLQSFLIENDLPVDYISSGPNNIDVAMTRSLTEPELVSLTNLITNFDESQYISNGTTQTILTTPQKTSNELWTKICAWDFPGKNNVEYTKANVHSFINSPLHSFSVRIYDNVRNRTVVSATFSNADEYVHTLNIPFDNLPLQSSIFELHAKVSSSNGIAHIQHMSLISL